MFYKQNVSFSAPLFNAADSDDAAVDEEHESPHLYGFLNDNSSTAYSSRAATPIDTHNIDEQMAEVSENVRAIDDRSRLFAAARQTLSTIACCLHARLFSLLHV